MRFESRQEVFDVAARGLAFQGFEQSMTRPDELGDATCLYHGPDGRHCAIGWLVADLSMGDVNDDRLAVMIRKRPDVAARFDGLFDTEYDRNDFLMELQRCHDIASLTEENRPAAVTPDFMREALRQFAEKHGLSPAALG